MLRETNNATLDALKRKLERQEKLAKYSNIFGILNSAFEHLHSCTRNGNAELPDFHHAFSAFCDNLAKAYTSVTGVECHVCIKLATSSTNAPFSEELDLNKMIIKTFCRSSSSPDRRIVDNGVYQHMLMENTSYEYIYTNYGKSFFSNNLPELEGYKNSSLKYHIHTDNFTFNKKPNSWPLPYKSTIVSPIVPSIVTSSDEKYIIGLLCVDCDIVNGFNPEPDKIILQGCADGLYNSFKKYATIVEKNKKDNVN